MSWGSSTAAARKNAVGCWMTTRMFAPTAAPLKPPMVFPAMSHMGLSPGALMPFWMSSIRLCQYF